jgi:hypothetical protein
MAKTAKISVRNLFMVAIFSSTASQRLMALRQQKRKRKSFSRWQGAAADKRKTKQQNKPRVCGSASTKPTRENHQNITYVCLRTHRLSAQSRAADRRKTPESSFLNILKAPKKDAGTKKMPICLCHSQSQADILVPLCETNRIWNSSVDFDV